MGEGVHREGLGAVQGKGPGGGSVTCNQDSLFADPFLDHMRPILSMMAKSV